MLLLAGLTQTLVVAQLLAAGILRRPAHLTTPGIWLGLALGYGAYVLLVRIGERRWPTELALRTAPVELLAGLGIGAVLMGLVYGVLVLSGIYQVAYGHAVNWPLQVFYNLATALVEELVFRAIVFRLLGRAFGVKPALVLSALLFGGMHLLNPNATPAAALAIAIEAGLMLAAFLLLTGRLWLPVGVHAAWNFTQGPVFGARVSGFTRPDTWLVSAPRPGQPTLLSGGAFGPEASIPALLVGAGAFVVVLFIVRWNRQRQTEP